MEGVTQIEKWSEHISVIEQIVGKPLLNMYMHGSRLYGSENDKSDWDCMVVVEEDEEDEENDGFRMIQEGIYDIHVYSREKFQMKLDSHSFDVIVSYFAPIFQTVTMTFTLDKKKLRSCVSQKADHSYVKAKKKNIEEKEYYLAKKSLYHSFRILNFGSQIAASGMVKNFNSCNGIHDEIMVLDEGNKTWEKWNDIFKLRFNACKSEFKKLAPK